MKAYAADEASTTTTTTNTGSAPATDGASTTSVAQNAEATTAQPAEGEAQKESPGFFDSPLMLVALGAVWIWLIWSMRKNKKKQKEAKAKLNDIKKGDKIVTIGRVHGEIVALTDATITIKPDKKSDYTLTFDRAAIMSVNADSKNAEEPAEGVAEKIEQK